MRQTQRLTLVFCMMELLLAAALFADGLGGSWIGTVDVPDPGSGSVISTKVRLDLVEKEGVLSGTIGRPGDDERNKISNVKREGASLRFQVSSPETTKPTQFTLAVQGDTIRGQMVTTVESTEIKGTVELKREP